ncbi:MAG: glutamyl-tRNA reductase [Chitinophagaceae bacterium]
MYLRQEHNSIKRFWVVGVNFQKTALKQRKRFAFSTDQIAAIYATENALHNKSFFILSTCNRTEVYGYVSSNECLLNIFLKYTKLNTVEIVEHVYSKSGNDAILHLHTVAAGLNSQIIGDYEIVGQLKQAFSLANSFKTVDGYIQKLVNNALQTSRKVRKKTAISHGTTSVAYAVMQHIRGLSNNLKNINICLMGVGNFGELILKNIRHFYPEAKLILINRNEEKAKEAAEKYGVAFLPIQQQQLAFQQSNILIMATGANQVLVTKEQMIDSTIEHIIDLSVPSNLADNIAHLSKITVCDIDILSNRVDENIKLRSQHYHAAIKIVQEELHKFTDWTLVYERRKLVAHWKKTVIDYSASAYQQGKITAEEAFIFNKKATAKFAIFLRKNTTVSMPDDEVISTFIAKNRIYNKLFELQKQPKQIHQLSHSLAYMAV